MKKIDLTNSKQAYMFGFMQADGHLYKNTRNRGRFSIELNFRDEHILKEFQKLIPAYSSIRKRNRDTNFKKDCLTSILTVCDKKYRDELVSLGIPYGEKSEKMCPPQNISQKDYIRGLIDANGSLGITKQNIPFISLTTKSEAIKEYYIDYIYKLTQQKMKINRNKRDNIYNIMIMRENAQKIVSDLYYDNCLALRRKEKNAKDVMMWKRPDNMVKRNCQIKRWSLEEDEYIKNHTVEESMEKLNRTKKSIETRLWRLSQ